MVEVTQLVFSAALQIVLTFWVIRRDERMLTGRALDRAYPAATFWIAVVVFGPLSIPLHFVRTRRNWAGLVLGALWLGGVLALIALAGFALELILE